MSTTKKIRFFFSSPIWVCKIAYLEIKPIEFGELSMLYRGMFFGSLCVFMLFLCMKILLIKEDEAPESIIAEREIVRERPWNMIGIFRCCPFTPEIEEEEIENDDEEINEEILFCTYESVALALYPDSFKNPCQTYLWPLLVLPRLPQV
jgi:hypothetical protein